MEYIKINEYPLERFGFGDEDYYDVDYFDGVGYQSAKIKGSVIKQAIINSVGNIYNTDGTLTGDRVVDGNNFFLTFDNITNLRFNTQGAPFGVSGFEINASPTGNLFTVKNATTGVVVLKVSSDSVYINNEYRLPTTDGTTGQIIQTDGAGNLSFIDASTVSANIYNSNGTLTANRTLDGANFELLLQNVGKFSVHSHLNNAENVEYRVRTNTTFYSLIVRDHNTNLALFGIKNGKTEINGVYTLPSVDGTTGQVLTTNGAGVTSWQSAPYTPPAVQLFDALASGGITSAVNTGAGYNRYFNGTGTAGRLSFNIGLRNNGVDYDGSTLQVRFISQIFNTNSGGNISYSVIYKFVKANGTTNAETGATTVTTTVNVTGRTANALYEDNLASISGVVGAEMLMISIVRNISGNSDLVDGIGLELIKL